VIYSLATSGPDDAPHGIEFLFSRHRLNVAEVGENIHAGQPVLVIEATGKRWLSFNAREDTLHGLTVGSKVDVGRADAREPTPALVTELMPLGSFATWQAERAIGDHDRSTLRLRLDPLGDLAALEPGMTVWLNR
jgi:HlyD family secretion protein